MGKGMMLWMAEYGLLTLSTLALMVTAKFSKVWNTK